LFAGKEQEELFHHRGVQKYVSLPYFTVPVVFLAEEQELMPTLARIQHLKFLPHSLHFPRNLRIIASEDARCTQSKVHSSATKRDFVLIGFRNGIILEPSSSTLAWGRRKESRREKTRRRSN
jgi:hypothetical protein